MKRPFRHALVGLTLALGVMTAAAVPAAPAAAQSATAPQYRRLMEMNGVARNVRLAVANHRAWIVQVVTERNGAPLTPAQQARLEVAMGAVLDPVTERTLDSIAQAQSPNFSDADISALIAANGSAAAGRYAAAKFASNEELAPEIQACMAAAAVAIILGYRDGAESPGPLVVRGADAAETERMALVRRLFAVDGTEALVSQFVRRSHIELILQEVGKHLDFDSMSEDDKRRFVAIATVEQENLIENILNLNARSQARLLSRADLETLIGAYDIPAQRTLTRIRLEDTGELDRQAATLLQAAAEQVIDDFENGR